MLSRTRAVGFGAAIVVLAGCSEATGPDIGGIEVTLSLSQDEVAVGDTIEIHVLATNTSTDPVSFTTNTCVLVVRVLDQSQTTPDVRIPDTCNDINQGHTLDPGQSLERVLLFDTTTRSGTFELIAGISYDLLNPSLPVQLRVQP